MRHWSRGTAGPWRRGVAAALSGLAALAVFISPAGAQGTAAEYVIGVDDAVQIQVWQRPSLNGVYVVDDKGNLNLPLIGEVRAEGRTATQLGDDLERRYSVMDPGISQVLVTVSGFNSRRYTVVGEVRAPGVFTFRTIPTLWETILQAGGETPNADMSQVQIVRTPEEGGATETITVDLSAGLEQTPAASIPPLLPGDSVVIPALEKNAVVGDQVQVLGSVRQPGLYPLRVASTVVEAISVSGGHLEASDLSEVRLTRRGEDGALVYTLDLEAYLKSGYPPADMPLRPGDTVTVPSGSSGAGSVFRSVLQLSGVLSAVAGIIIAANSLN